MKMNYLKVESDPHQSYSYSNNFGSTKVNFTPPQSAGIATIATMTPILRNNINTSTIGISPSGAQQTSETSLFRSKLHSVGYPNTPQEKKTIKDSDQAFLAYTPLPGQLPSHSLTNSQTKSGFLDFLRGDLNEEELLYIRNFPNLYESLPDPKKLYLRMYIREAKGDFSHGAADGINSLNGNDDNDIDDNLEDDEEDYMDEEEFRYRLRVSQQKSNLNSIVKPTMLNTHTSTPSSQSNKKKLKSVGFFEDSPSQPAGNFNMNQISPNKGSTTLLLMQNSRKSIVLDKINLLQNQRNAVRQSVIENQAEKQQKVIMKNHINRSLNNLKSKILDNIALRKGTDPATLENASSSGKLKMENTKFFSSLAGLHLNAQEQIANRDRNNQSEGGGRAGKNQVNKILKNLSIITKQTAGQKQQAQAAAAANNFNHIKGEIGGRSVSPSTINRQLYKRYFRENADTFIRTLQEPYDPKMRSRLQKSDAEYSKFLQSYFSKVHIANQNKKHQPLCNSMTPENKNQFYFEGRDLLTLNKEQSAIEKRCIDQIGDLDNYSQKHMIQSLTAYGLKREGLSTAANSNAGQKNNHSNSFASSNTPQSAAATSNMTTTSISSHQHNSHGILRKRPNRSKQQKSLVNLSATNNTFGNNQTQNLTQTRTSFKDNPTATTPGGSFLTLPPPLLTNKLNKRSSNHVSGSTLPGGSQFNIIGSTGSIRIPPGSRGGGLNNESLTAANGVAADYSANVTSATPTAAAAAAAAGSTSSSNSGAHPYFLAHPQNPHALKMQKRLETLEKKGYHIIKRNQSEHFNLKRNESNDDLHFEESDDSANASRTEATLEVLYSESIAIQNKLMAPPGENDSGLIRKLKQMIKLEGLKKNVIKANLYKLEQK